MTPSPSRRARQGEIWLADLNPPVGHEAAGPPRPVLIVSRDVLNKAPHELCVIVPLSSKIKKLPGHIFISAGDSGLRTDSEIMCEHLRSISQLRFRSSTPISDVPASILLEVSREIARMISVV